MATPPASAKKKAAKAGGGDRTFRRLDAQDAPSAPLPVAWAFGLALGVLGGLAAMGVDVALLERARVPVLPALDAPSVLPWVVGHAALGGALGLLGGSTGLFGPRWATAAVCAWLGWLGASPVIAATAGTAVPPVVALVASLLGGAVLGQVAGRVPLPAWVHAGVSALVFAGSLVLVPLHQHLLSSSLTVGALAASFAGLALAAPFAAVVALGARDGRPPVLSLLALVSLGAGGALALRVAPAPAPAAAPAGPTVVVVAIDGVRADDLGALPALAALAERAVRFDQARSSSNWAVPALGTLLTGRLPYGHQAGLNGGSGPLGAPLDPRVPTVAGTLRARGFATIGVTAGPALRRYGLDGGFAVWDDAPASGAAPAAAAPLRAAGLVPAAFSDGLAPGDVTDRALAHLAARAGTSTFLLVHQAGLRAGGDAAAMDAALGRLFAGVPADAWLVVVGTHGRAGRDRRASVEDAASDAMFDERIHVPLLVRGPRVAPRRVERVVGAADVPATVAEILKAGGLGEAAAIPAPDGAVLAEVFGTEGSEPTRHVLAQSSGRGVEHQAIVAWPYKLVRSRGNTALYDLSHDPEEIAPLRIDPSLDPLERQLEAALPTDGGPAGRGGMPGAVVQFGQIAARAWGDGR